MEICKNKATGKNFIYLETAPEGKFRLIAPDAVIRLLNPDLFEKPQDEDDKYLLSHGLITVEQDKRYTDFFKKDLWTAWKESGKRNTGLIDRLLSALERLTPAQEKEFFEMLKQIELE